MRKHKSIRWINDSKVEIDLFDGSKVTTIIVTPIRVNYGHNDIGNALSIVEKKNV